MVTCSARLYADARDITMPTTKATNIELSDSELDELLSDGEEEKKPEAGPYGGAISKPRHVTTSCKLLHGKL